MERRSTMGRKKMYFTKEEQDVAARRWRATYRKKINSKLKRLEKLEKMMKRGE
jgi:hypothetical protein